MKVAHVLREKVVSCALSRTGFGGKPVEKVLAPHPLFDLHYELGSREFFLYSDRIHDAIVLVHCTVCNRFLRPLEGGCGRVTGKGTRFSRSRPQNCSMGTSPVEFSAFVSVLGSGLTIEASCSSMLSLLLVDGVTVHNGLITDSLVPREGRSVGEMLYQGPSLNQRNLTETVINVRSNISPLDSLRQEQAFFFDPHVRPWSSRFMRFGHMPVHTVRPVFADALSRFLERFRIDDDLAAFVEQFAHVVQQKEKAMWARVVREITK